jgi:L-ascorbate metabolism protein UlaG (beta-lactamase superfamily)
LRSFDLLCLSDRAMPPELGFDTIGNATLIAYDGGPVLATDPWLDGPAYFGSWWLSHEVPAEQRAQIEQAQYIVVSHGHPDHLSYPSLERLRDKKILVPDHHGGRIADQLRADGFEVQVLPDRRWVELSDRVRILAIGDPNQDGVLLVDIDGVLVVDANDASDRGWGSLVRKIVRQHPRSFLLALSGYGDADMINYFDADGERILPAAAAKRPPGAAIQRRVEWFGVRWFVPFASMHRYRRTDSVWADSYTTPAHAHADGFASTRAEILPAFVRYDCVRDIATPIAPPPSPSTLHDPEEFGDSWDEPLQPDDVDAIARYFGAIHTLRRRVDQLTFRVGGVDHSFTTGSGSNRSVRFETPRASLRKAVDWEIFDDLLIGNYMRTTLLGDWHGRDLSAHFTPYVAKYADNGRAKTPAGLRAYRAAYFTRAPLDMLRFDTAARSQALLTAQARAMRSIVREGSVAHRMGQRAYGFLRR